MKMYGPLFSYAFFVTTGTSASLNAPFDLWLQGVDFGSDFDSVVDNEQSYVAVSLSGQAGTLASGETGLLCIQRFKSNIIGAASATVGSFNKYCLFPGQGFFIEQNRAILVISAGTGLLTSNVCLHMRRAS